MSDKEKKLLIVFLSLLFLVVGALGVVKYVQLRSNMIEKKAILVQELDVAKLADSTHAALATEKEWLKKNEPSVTDYDLARGELRKFVENASKKFGFDTKTMRITDGYVTREHYAILQVTERAENITQEQMIQWLLTLHDPEKFRSVVDLTVIQDQKEPGNVRCDVTVQQWVVEGKTDE